MSKCNGNKQKTTFRDHVTFSSPNTPVVHCRRETVAAAADGKLIFVEVVDFLKYYVFLKLFLLHFQFVFLFVSLAVLFKYVIGLLHLLPLW